ncbi:MAG: T9SS type B sorting domain-containing protein [Luteibaculaceae bacterium]
MLKNSTSLPNFFTAIVCLFLVLSSELKAQTCTPTTTITQDDIVGSYLETVNLCDLENTLTQTTVCSTPGALPVQYADRNDYLLKIEVTTSTCFNIRITPNIVDFPGFQFLSVYVLDDCPQDGPNCIFRRFPIPGNAAGIWQGDQSLVPVSLPAAGEYYIWISGGGTPNAPVCGEFELELIPATTGCATCDDGVQNGTETGVDCGGPFCDPCNVADFTINQGGTQTTCDASFADSGNLTGNYGILENHTITFCPDQTGQCMRAVFDNIDIRNGDFLRVYAGNSVNAPLLGTFTNTQTIPAAIFSSVGCLTFNFTSNASGTGAGWLINLECDDCPPSSEFVMGNLGTITNCVGGQFTDSGDTFLSYSPNENTSFTFCSDDDDLCPSLIFSQMNLLPGARLRIYNGTNFTSPIMADITGNQLPAELIATSGCMTFRFTSDASQQVGAGWVGQLSCTPCPEAPDFIMGNGSVTTCDAGTFSDSGGAFAGYLSNENFVYTYCSADNNLCPNIDFSFLNLLPGAVLRVFDGPNTSAPLMNTLTGNTPPNQVLQSSTGCLTFQFTSNNASVGGQGWLAELFCGPCATCDDGIQNGFESGVDCGGPCEPCPEIFINEGGTVFTCSSFFYDSGGPNGNYQTGENHTIIICPGAEAEPGQVTSVFFDAFQLGAADRLQIRDGQLATSPLVNLLNLNQPAAGFNGTQLAGRTVQASVNNASGCLRFTFTSGAFSSQPGWIGDIFCAFPCQPFTIEFSDINPEPDSDGVVVFCDFAEFTLNGIFPNNNVNYNQNNLNITWTGTVLGQTTSITGDTILPVTLGNNTGLRNRTLTVFGVDEQGCRSSNSIQIDIRQPLPKPNITFNYETTNLNGNLVVVDQFTNPVDTACLGTPFNVNFDAIAEPFLATATAASINFTPPHHVDVGTPVNYPFSFEVSGITGLPTITSGLDVENICVNMEHSFMGDLEIWLVCPNGQEVSLYHRPHTGWANEGGGTDLGQPVLGTGVPGVGFDYCWTNEAELNWGQVATQPGVAVLPAGDYAPYSSFDNLIGCPVNGIWTMNFTNHFPADDGYVFNFEFNIRGLEVVPEITSTSVQWQGSELWPAPMSFVPQNNGFVSYEIMVGADLGGFGDLGCDFTDSLRVNVRPCDVVAPNVISPNGDGVNDTWILEGDLSRIQKVLVFNRWGKTVYEASGYSNDAPWDGRHNGGNLPTGTYFYIIELQEQTPLKGEITLFR